jgi:hypothetical protein
MDSQESDRQRFRRLMAESSGSTPRPIPPHPPLVSGGWYHGMSVEEVLGPGRVPLEEPVDRSVGAALALTMMFGPVGLFYVSMVGGLACTALTIVAVLLYGPAPLLIAWPISMVCSGIIAGAMRKEYRQ